MHRRLFIKNMLLDQNLPSDSSSSPASTLVRGSSEPPENTYNEINGLRRSRNPIKVAGITMGSQENLAANDELSSVFARRRRRRSATPVKIGGIVMGDGLEGHETDVPEAPFGGTTNKRNSYHPGMNRKNSNMGMWGQRFFTNTGTSNGGTTEQFRCPDDDSNSFEVKKDEEGGSGICDVKQFLTDMQKEITALTNSAKDEQVNDSHLKVNRMEMTESFNAKTSETTTSEKTFSQSQNCEMKSESSQFTSTAKVIKTEEYHHQNSYQMSSSSRLIENGHSNEQKCENLQQRTSTANTSVTNAMETAEKGLSIFWVEFESNDAIRPDFLINFDVSFF